MILVGDMLARYQPDALRYFICAAGPETSDADFTWAEFVQRTNSELVAGWGNLVNRTATMIAKSFGEIPPAGDARAGRRGGAGRRTRRASTRVGDLIGRHRQRAAIAEAMRVVGEVNKYLTVTEPYKMKDEAQRERLGTVLHVAAQCVLGLQHAARAVPAALGQPRCTRCSAARASSCRCRASSRSTSSTPTHGAGLATYPVITGDYSATPALGVPAGRRSGRRSRQPTPSSPSSTRRWSTRSSRGSRADQVLLGDGTRFRAAAPGR